MAFLSVEDMYGAIEVIVFPRIFTENAVKLQEGNVILLSGRLSLREDEDPKVDVYKRQSLSRSSR